MKSTSEEMDRIWNYDTVRGEKPTFYELNLERRVKVLEAQVAELLWVAVNELDDESEVDALVALVEIQHETNS
jgi:hypothetical protein